MTTNNETTYEIIEISTNSWLEDGTPELLSELATTTSARHALIIHNALCAHHEQWDGSIVIIREGDESRTDITAELADDWDIDGEDVASYLMGEMGYTEEEAERALNG